MCPAHGGAAPQVKAAGQRRAAAELVRRATATYGLSVEVDPRDALLQEVHRTAGHVAWLAERVEAIAAEDLVWGKVEEVDLPPGENHDGGLRIKHASAPNAWLKLYQEERRHLADVCKTAIAAGIEERRVQLAEQQGAMLAWAIRAILADLDLTPAQQALVPSVVPRHLRAVAGGG